MDLLIFVRAEEALRAQEILLQHGIPLRTLISTPKAEAGA